MKYEAQNSLIRRIMDDGMPKCIRRCRLLLLLLVVGIFICAPMAAMAEDATVDVGTFAELTRELTNSASDIIINITDEFDIISKVTIPSGKNVTLQSTDGELFTLTRGPDFQDIMFTVPVGCSLTLQNITLEGSTTNSFNSIIFASGTLVLGNGATLQNNENASTPGGAVRLNSQASFTMKQGSAITNCKGTGGGGVQLYNEGTTFTMNGGTISDCTAVTQGGGVQALAGTTFIMNGGSITGCKVQGSNTGKGVHLSGSVFDISGAPSIDANNGVYLDLNSSISVTGALTGGSIPIEGMKSGGNTAGTVIATRVGSTPDLNSADAERFLMPANWNKVPQAMADGSAIRLVNNSAPPAPNITAQPDDADYILNESSPEPLRVTATVASGGSLSYQWYRNDRNSIVGGTPIDLATDYECPPSTNALGTLYYYVEVTNTQDLYITDSSTTTSEVAAVAVGPLVDAEMPTIENQPKNIHCTLNDNITLSVGANVNDGGVLSYQWYSNTTDSVQGGTKVGDGRDLYSPPTSALGTRYYYVVVTNTNDNVNGVTTATTTSNVAAVTVQHATSQPTFIKQPQPESVLVGGRVTFGVEVLGAPVPSLQWQVSADCGTTWTDIQGETEPDLYIDDAGLELNGNLYRCVANNGIGGNVSSKPVALTVMPAFNDSQQMLLDAYLLELKVGQCRTLKHSLATPKASGSVRWSSSNGKIATVNGKGKLKAKKKGIATITCMLIADPTISRSCLVYVNMKAVHAARVTMTPTAMMLNVGKSAALTARVEPENVATADVIWSSSDPAVVRVDWRGVVQAVAPGKAVITATSVTKTKAFASALVLVPDEETHVPVTGVTLPDKKVSIEAGECHTLIAGVVPANASIADVTWKSSASNIATVDAKGNVRGLAPGTAVITVTSVECKKSASTEIEVRPAVIRITTLQQVVYLAKGEKATLPVMASSKLGEMPLKWSTNNASILSISQAGVIKGLKNGLASVVAEDENGAKLSIQVSVGDGKATSALRLSLEPKSLQVGETRALQTHFAPTNARGALSFKSSNTKVLAVDKLGNVTGVKKGTATITVSMGQRKNTLKITVK